MQKDETTLADREARLIEQLNERAKLIVELLQMIRFGNQGFAGGIHIQRARRIIDGLPEAIAEGEANYRAYCLASPDHVHEGTLEELATCARMLDEYGIKEMPANEKGQIEFNRALMESTVGAINAYIVNHRQATEARMQERVRAEGLVAALENIETLCTGEINARFAGHPHMTIEQCGRKSKIYSLLVLPRNIAASALTAYRSARP